MTGFNYLPARPTLRLAAHLQLPLLLVCVSLCVVAGAFSIERMRLHKALTIETQYSSRYADSAARLRKQNIYYRDVLSVLALDAQIRAIQSSGAQDAATIADIADALPQAAYARGITRDASGLALEGRASDMDTIGDLLRRLRRVHGLRNPILREAALASDRPGERAIRYEVHIDTHA